ncbi:MAG: dihydropteroate synthase [Firmicutes bacterium]|nr:dihydropteroate synthase [Bacillota bacterium]
MRIGNREFDTDKHTYIMGILNVTPDSFSDGGRWNELDAALKHAELMINQGADIIDVGGESTRPGHIQISEQEEIERVTPIIERLKAEFDAPVSIDTYKANVAEAALQEGADLVNDIWGLQYDPRMAEVIKQYNAACCLMHNRNEANYNNLILDMMDDLRKSIELAHDAGIRSDKVILDPGVGFGKTLEHNLLVMKELSAFRLLGYPLLLGTSRKSMIGKTLDLPSDQREEGTLVTTVMAVESGYGFVRVHDVEKNYRAIKMAEAILAAR